MKEGVFMSRYMGAYIKTIPIHSVQGISNCLIYTEDEKKTIVFEREDGSKTKVVTDRDGNIIGNNNTIDTDIQQALAYAGNIEKTSFELDGDKDILVSGHNCFVETAEAEFAKSKARYEHRLRAKGIDPASRITATKKDGSKGQARVAYHLVMSFAEPDISPQLVHHIGQEFCNRALGDTCAVISTHMNTQHCHNHIVFSAFPFGKDKKYNDDLNQVAELRNIVNEISMEYGLGIELGLDQNVADRSFLNWSNQTSWKEELKKDIETAIEHSSNWREYESKMLEYGWKIRTTNKTTTYISSSDENRKVRDSKLGTDFSRANVRYKLGEITLEDRDKILSGELLNKDVSSILRENATKDDIKKKQDEELIAMKREESDRVEKAKRYYKPHLNIYVERYTPTGRRRSDLELLFLGAIKLITHFKDTYKVPEANKAEKNNNPYYWAPEVKLANMGYAARKTLGLGIRDYNHLIELKNLAGAELSHVKKQIEDFEVAKNQSQKIYNALSSVLDMKKEIQKRGLDDIDIRVNEYTPEQIQAENAKVWKLSPEQTRQIMGLFDKINGKEKTAHSLRTTKNFSEYSYREGEQIIEALKKIKDGKPYKCDLILTQKEYELRNNKAYCESFYRNNMVRKDETVSLTDAHMERFKKLKEKHPELKDVTPTKYSEWQAIVNYYECRVNPFEGELCDENRLNRIIERLTEKGLKLNRSSITEKEATILERYLAGKMSSLPRTLKESKPISEKELDRLSQLMELKGVEVAFSDLSILTKNDFFVLFNYLVNIDYVPDILKKDSVEEQNAYRSNAFWEDIKDLKDEDKALLNRYRTAVNGLAKLGYSEEDYIGIADQHRAYSKELENLKYQEIDKKNKYKSLANIERSYHLAGDENFTKGTLFRTPEIAKESVKKPVQDVEIVTKENAPKPVEKPVKTSKTEVKSDVTNVAEDIAGKGVDAVISDDIKGTYGMEELNQMAKKLSEILIKGLVLSFSEDGLVVIENKTGKDISIKDDVYGKFNKTLSAGDSQKMKFKSLDGTKAFIENISNNKLSFELAPEKVKEAPVQPHTEVVKPEVKTPTSAAPKPVETPKAPIKTPKDILNEVIAELKKLIGKSGTKELNSNTTLSLNDKLNKLSFTNINKDYPIVLNDLAEKPHIPEGSSYNISFIERNTADLQKVVNGLKEGHKLNISVDYDARTMKVNQLYSVTEGIKAIKRTKDDMNILAIQNASDKIATINTPFGEVKLDPKKQLQVNIAESEAYSWIERQLAVGKLDIELAEPIEILYSCKNYSVEYSKDEGKVKFCNHLNRPLEIYNKEIADFLGGSNNKPVLEVEEGKTEEVYFEPEFVDFLRKAFSKSKENEKSITVGNIVYTLSEDGLRIGTDTPENTDVAKLITDSDRQISDNIPVSVREDVVLPLSDLQRQYLEKQMQNNTKAFGFISKEEYEDFIAEETIGKNNTYDRLKDMNKPSITD